MTNGQMKLGFCPIGKFVFSHEDAMRYKGVLEEKLKQWGIDFVGIDPVVKDGMIRDMAHAEPAVRHLRSQQVDGVFMPHCNFGTEGAVGLIGRDLGVPVLLWGPRDAAPLPDGTRLRDTLCGLFASGKVLHKLGVPFTYIENCDVNDPAFEKGTKDFVRVMSVVKAFRTLRIGQIGERLDFFWTTICNESELLERFGIEIEPIDIAEVIRDTRARAERDASQYRDEIEELRKKITIEGLDDPGPMMNVLALRDEMLQLAHDRRVTALAVRTFTSFYDLGAMADFAMSLVNDAGVPAATECDIHGAVSCAMLRAAGLNSQPPFLADFTIRHPTDDNAILLWHCDFALSLKKQGTPAKVGTHWILPNAPPTGMCHWQLRDGDITVARFDGDRGDYRLAAGEGHTIDGPFNQNTYVWMKVNDWPRWERQLVEGPYIHHVGAVYGRYAPVLTEACKYIPGLTPERLGRTLPDDS